MPQETAKQLFNSLFFKSFRTTGGLNEALKEKGLRPTVSPRPKEQDV